MIYKMHIGDDMIDLRKFYLEEINKKEYYYRFYDFIKGINIIFDPFDGEPKEIESDVQFLIYDSEEAIKKFRELCEPNEEYNEQNKCWFYVVSFYLYKHGYYIEQFPNVLKRPPEDITDFTYSEIRDWAFSHNLNDGNKIRFATRREIVAKMHFTISSSFIEIGESLEDAFQRISTNDISFQEKKIDEKIKEIANLIENLLKENGKFKVLNYKNVAFDYLTNDDVKQFRKQIQCFRHASNDSIKEREHFTNDQKKFLVDYGIVICKTIYCLKNLNN